jgi:hypothetical protein
MLNVRCATFVAPSGISFFPFIVSFATKDRAALTEARAIGEKATQELLNWQPRNPVFLSLLLEGRVSTDGNSFLESLWNATASTICNVIDAHGWIFPALFLTVLLLGVITLFAWIVEDLPFELEIFRSIGGIFKWARAQWGPERTASKLSL